MPSLASFNRQRGGFPLLMAGVAAVGALLLVPRLPAVVPFLLVAVLLSVAFQRQRAHLIKAQAALRSAAEENRKLRRTPLIDPQTLTFSRNFLEYVLAMESRRALRSRQPAAVALLQLQMQGAHAAPAEIVIEAASVLRSNFRSCDFVFRYTEDSFLVLMPETAPLAGQLAVDRLMARVQIWNEETPLRQMEMTWSQALVSSLPGEDMGGAVRTAEAMLLDAGLQQPDAIAIRRKASTLSPTVQ